MHIANLYFKTALGSSFLGVIILVFLSKKQFSFCFDINNDIQLLIYIYWNMQNVLQILFLFIIEIVNDYIDFKYYFKHNAELVILINFYSVCPFLFTKFFKYSKAYVKTLGINLRTSYFTSRSYLVSKAPYKNIPILP